MHPKILARWLLCVTLILLACLPARAAPPQAISYQGFLTSSAGQPVNATLSVQFTLYKATNVGGALWSETLTVTVTNGNYSVILGNGTPLSLPFDEPYVLGVKVGADAEMTPRAALTMVPYAFRALNAEIAASVAGSGITGAITTATISGTQIAGAVANATSASMLTGSVSGTQITGAITTATISGTQITGTTSNTIQLGNADVTNVNTNAAVAVGTGSINSSAQLEVSSTSKGFLPPRMTMAQRDAINSPVIGLMVFCNNCGPYGEPQFYTGSAWKKFDGTSVSGTGTVFVAIDQLFSPSGGTNVTGGVGQSFLVPKTGGRIEKIVTDAIGGVPASQQLTNGIAGSYLRIRKYVNDIELTSVSSAHALTGDIIATSSGTPTILNFDYGIYFPSVEFVFENGVYLEPNTKYVIQFVVSPNVSAYVSHANPYSDGQAYDIDGINLFSPRDFPFRLYLRQYP